MRCTVCGRDHLVTYRSAQLGERAMCATCIRAGRYGRLGRAAAHSLIRSVRRSLGLTSQVERMRIAGEAAAEGIRQGHERARAERERHTFRVDPGSFDAHTVTIFDNDNWTVGHPYTCKHGWLVTGCPVTEAVRQHLDTGRLEENEHWATGEYWCWLDRNSDNILVVPMEPETLREPAEPMKPQPMHPPASGGTMTDRCAACGRLIVAVRDLGPPINLDRYVWRHRSWWANRTHHAVPARDWED